jgi:hypothetical protein
MGGKGQREFPADARTRAGDHDHLILNKPTHETSTSISD